MTVPKPPTYTAEQADAWARERGEAAERKRLETSEAADRRTALEIWKAEGGDPADFEREWPSIRKEQLRRRVIDRAEAARRATADYWRERF
jgi:hypothetical protein